LADNTVLDAGAGGDTIATDDVAGVKYQVVKLAVGADGAADLVATANPIPVIAVANSGVDIGDVTINNASLAVTGTFWQATQPVSGTVAVTNAGITTIAGAVAGTEMQVDVLTLPNVVLASGTVTAVTDITNAVKTVGPAAHDAVVSGAPVRLGAYAKAAAPTDVSADGDTVNVWADLAGRVAVWDGGLNVSIDDGGNTITVDGTVAVTGVATAANQTTIIGHVDGLEALLTTIDADTSNLSVVGGGTEATAIRVTIANNSTGVLSVDDNGGALTVDGTVDVGTVTTVTAVTAITNALPAGTNNIGDVDVLTVVTGTGATNLGKAVDGVAGATDTGVLMLAVRDDALAALTPADGDYTQLRVSSTGALHVTGGGGGTQYNIDDVASATAAGTVALVVRKDTGASLAGTDGDVTGLQVDANGALRVTGGGGGTEYTVDAAAPAAPTGATFVMERDDALSALTEVEGDWTNPRANANGALWVKQDGTAVVDGSGVTQPVSNAGLTALNGAIAGTEVQVDVLTMPTVTVNAHAVTNAGTFATQVDGAALTALQLIDNLVLAEDAAHASADPGVLALAVRRDTAAVGSGTDGDNSTLNVDATGRLWAHVGTIDAGTITTVSTVTAVTAITNALPAGTNNIGDVDVLTIAAGDNNIGNVDIVSLPALAAGTNLIGSVAAAPVTGAIYQGTTARTPVFTAIDAATSGDNTLVAAAGASNKIRVHALYLVAAGTTTVRFESGAGGTALSGQMNLIANTGFVLPFNEAGWFETAANTLLNLELSAAVSIDGGMVHSVVT
jgi:hypothetical protein